jgi:hypothetical protein
LAYIVKSGNFSDNCLELWVVEPAELADPGKQDDHHPHYLPVTLQGLRGKEIKEVIFDSSFFLQRYLVPIVSQEILEG